MFKGFPRHSQHSSSSQSDNESPQVENLQHESQFHTFAAKKSSVQENQREEISSQQEDESLEDEINQQSHSSSKRNSDEDSETDKRHDDESIDKIEARIKRLEYELSRKLKKISPERQVQKPASQQVGKLFLKTRQEDSPLRPQQKQDLKKQSISPKHKKLKSKETGHSSNPNIATKQPPLKRVNESHQAKTVEDSKVSKVNNNRKPVQPQQSNSKEATYKQTIEDLKRQNQQLKSKIQSKPKKRSCLQKDIEDMDYLKSKIGSSEITKLEKEIELLKILQSIRGKLKKSINRKLSKLYPDNDHGPNKSKITAFLLHRGCPANYLSS